MPQQIHFIGSILISLERPVQQDGAGDKQAATINLDHRTIGEIGQFCVPYPLAKTPWKSSFSVQFSIQNPGRCGNWNSSSTIQRGSIGFIIVTAAFRAGPVARSKRSHFIEEEQLRIAARRHDGPLPSVEFGFANDPVLVTPSAVPDIAMGVMKYSPVAHERTVGRVGDKFTFRGYPVLPWIFHKFISN